MKKASVIGHYAYGLEYLDGQTVKTKIVTNELIKKYGETEVLQFDTHGGIKTLIKAPIYAWKAMKRSSNAIILPAHNGLRIFGRILPFLKIFFRKRKIHYVVIGGWLPKATETKKGLARSLKKFDGIYVETNKMKQALESQGFGNVFIMPNFKDLTPITESELVYQKEAPFRLCTFSRVMKEKGIEDAVEAVKKINSENGKIVYTLDIYGQIDPLQNEWFEKLKANMPDYVKYCGLVPFDKSAEALKNYFALLFPTRFYTEGIPGTIIDAYAAGIPVISSMWENFNDVVDDYVTGIGYEFKNVDNLEQKLRYASERFGEINGLKMNCLQKSEQFLPSKAIETIVERLL